MSIVLSISCISYNHAPYIRACLDGFLMQKTNFPFEILIHDDCSTDGTREIIEEYSQKYPNIIFPMFQKDNQYSKGVRGMMARFNFTRSRGKYIALCEGDDYWTDPYKLQKQVDFLDANPDYILCFHDANYSYLDGSQKKISDKFSFLNLKNTYTKLDLLKHQWFIPTASIVCKNSLIKFPDYFFKVNAGDFNLQLYLSNLGKFHFISEVMSVYRITGQGVSSAKHNPLKRINDLNIWVKLVGKYDKKYILRWTLANYKLLLKLNLNNKNYFSFLNNFFISIKIFFFYIYYLNFYLLKIYVTDFILIKNKKQKNF